MTDELSFLKNKLNDKLIADGYLSKYERKQKDRRAWMRHMILGEEYQGIPTEDIPNPKALESWEGAFFVLVGRKMTEGEFLLFTEKYENKDIPVQNGWGIKDWIAENGVKSQ